MATATSALPASTPRLRDGATLRVAPTTTTTAATTTTTAAWVSTACVGHHPTCVSSQCLLRQTYGVQTLRARAVSQPRTAAHVATRDSTVVPSVALRNTHVAVSWAYCARSGKSLFEVCWALPWAVAPGPYCSCLRRTVNLHATLCLRIFSPWTLIRTPLAHLGGPDTHPPVSCHPPHLSLLYRSHHKCSITLHAFNTH